MYDWLLHSNEKDIKMNFKTSECTQSDSDYICDRLVEYNLEQVPLRQKIEFENLSRKIVDDDNKIIGGIIAKMYCWNVVYVDILWVDTEYRGKRIGSYLLDELEKTAERKSVTLIHLDTFDFQAKDFYLKNGYELFGVLEDCPEGHTRYYLKKYIKKKL